MRYSLNIKSENSQRKDWSTTPTAYVGRLINTKKYGKLTTSVGYTNKIIKMRDSIRINMEKYKGWIYQLLQSLTVVGWSISETQLSISAAYTDSLI